MLAVPVGNVAGSEVWVALVVYAVPVPVVPSLVKERLMALVVGIQTAIQYLVAVSVWAVTVQLNQPAAVLAGIEMLHDFNLLPGLLVPLLYRPMLTLKALVFAPG